MATRMKTVQFAFPTLASLTNNTLTTLTQTTLYLPETTKTIVKAWVEISCDDIVTATGGSLTTKTINLRLGAAAYTSTVNANVLTNSGENTSFMFTRDFTSHFTTNWTGASMTCDIQIQLNQSTGTTLGMVNVGAIVYITYEYDDTATTHIKTVLIPLNAPTTFLPTTKTSHDTIPALDTYLPEASKVYRNIHIVAFYNQQAVDATDNTVTYELSSLGTTVTGNYEGWGLTDRLCRYVWNITSIITTNSTHTFNVHSSITARMHAPQFYMVVTYEYNHTTSTSIMNSIELPKYLAPTFGMTTTNYERVDFEWMVMETNPVFNKIAAYLYWNTQGIETTISFRLGTGSFVGYTHGGASTMAGNKTVMVRNDSPTGATLARGKCKVNCDFSSAHASQRGWGVNGFLLVNYTSDKHTNGAGVHNHTIKYPLYTEINAGSISHYTTAALGVSIPETNYFLNSIGFQFMCNGYLNAGMAFKMERLTTGGEGGLKWDIIGNFITGGDTELGISFLYFDDKTFIRCCPQQNLPKIDIETARRWVLEYGQQMSSTSPFMFEHFYAQITYHAITYQSTLTIQNSAGATVTVNIFDTLNQLKQTYSRTGNGDITLIGYDDTEDYQAAGGESSTKRGMTDLFKYGS